jgi:chromosome segregation ATPase
MGGYEKKVQALASENHALRSDLDKLTRAWSSTKRRLASALKRIEELMTGIKALSEQARAAGAEPCWQPSDWEDNDDE